MECDKLISQVNKVDEEFAENVELVFEKLQKFKNSVKSATDDIKKNKKGKDVIARLKSLYVELGGKHIDYDDPLPKEKRAVANKENVKRTIKKSSDQVLKEISTNVDNIDKIGDFSKVTVKIERITLHQEKKMETPNINVQVIQKQEKIDPPVVIKQEKLEMLPPKQTTIKKGAVPKKKQPTRTKKRTTTRKQTRDSDVILQVPETVTVNLVEDDANPIEDTALKRSTRTKTKKLLEASNMKRIRSPSTDTQKTPQKPRAKRIKSNSNKGKIIASSSESEAYITPKSDFDSKGSPETMSAINLNNNNKKKSPKVFLTPLRKSFLNKYTVKMIPECTDVQNEMNVLPANVADIMTDDESMDEKPTKEEEKVETDVDQISPVKKRVEAFEKLANKVITDTPVQRVTRTKTRNLAKAKLEETQTPVKADKKKDMCTPLADRFMPTSISTAKIDRKMPALAIPAKTLSAIKASQKELRELEERKRKREAEMAKKREAIVQAATEERNRRQLEKEKMLQQKQREDAEKRKLLAKQRSEERRREEDLKRAEEEKLRKQQEKEKERLELEKNKAELAKKKAVAKNKPLYMIQKAPLLPTYECYDSDDPEAKTSNLELQRPDWTRSNAMLISLKSMLNIDDKLKNTLFCPAPQTPDLEEIFENIDPKKLRRNSSAIWNHHPRFTLMHSISEDF